MNKSMKRIFLGIIGIFLIFLLCLAILQNIRKSDNEVQVSTDNKLSKMRYAIVNEDAGGDYNDKRYSLGIDFVSLVSQDSDASWTNVSRSIAEAGIDNGSFDAYIIIPQDFSQKLLDLKSLNPDQATIKYKVRSGKNEAVNLKMSSKVNNILATFNKKIINMYFSTVLGHVQDAQLGVEKATDSQSEIKRFTSDQILNPFTQVPDDFKGVESSYTSLNEQHKSWSEQVDSFSKDAKGLITDNSSSLSSFDQNFGVYKDLQKQIAENNVKNAQEAINKEFKDGKEDLDNYYNGTKEKLNLVDGSDDQNLLFNNIWAKIKTQDSKVDDLKEKNTSLEKQANNLDEQLKNRMIENNKIFFGGKDVSQITDKELKEIIIGNTFGEQDVFELNRTLPESYKNKILDLKKKVPSNLLEILDKLNAEKLLSDEDKMKYRFYFTALEKFDGDFGNEEEIGFKKLNKGVEYLGEKKTITLYPGEEIRLIPKSTKNLQVDFGLEEIKDDDVTVKERWNSNIDIKNNSNIWKKYIVINPKYTILNDVDDLSISAEYIIKYYNDRKLVKEETTEPENPDDKGKIPNPENPDDKNKTTKPEETPKLENPDTNVDTSKLIILPKTEHESEFRVTLYRFHEGEEKLDKLNLDEFKDTISKTYAPLNNLSSALVSMRAIYGSSAEDNDGQEDQEKNDLETYAIAVAMADNFEETITNDSIYKTYGIVTRENISSIVGEGEVNAYKETGRLLADNLKSNIKDLDYLRNSNDGSSIKTMADVIKAYQSNETGVEATMNSLRTWYINTSNYIDQYYKSKEGKSSIVLSVDESGNPGENRLSVDSAKNKEMADQINSLVESSKSTADTIEKNKLAISDLTNDFNSIKTSTNKAQEISDSILKNVKDLDKNFSEQNDNNKEFTKNLKEALANSRNGGADNEQYLKFLADPVNLKNESSQDKRTVRSILPYLFTIGITGLVYCLSFINRRLTKVWRVVLPLISVSLFIGLSILSRLTGIAGLPLFTFYNLLVFYALWLLLNSGTDLTRRIFGSLVTLLMTIYLITNTVLGVSGISAGASRIMKYNPFTLIEDGYASVIESNRLGILQPSILSLIIAAYLIMFAVKYYRRRNESVSTNFEEDSL